MAGADAGRWRGGAAIGGTGEAGPFSLLCLVAPRGTGCKRKEDDTSLPPSSERTWPFPAYVLTPPTPRPWGKCWYCLTPATKGSFAPQKSTSADPSSLPPLSPSALKDVSPSPGQSGLVEAGQREEEEEGMGRDHQ